MSPFDRYKWQTFGRADARRMRWRRVIKLRTWTPRVLRTRAWGWR